LTEEARTTAGECYRRAVRTAEAAKQEFISFVREPVPRSTIRYPPSLRRGTGGRFSDGMRKLYYDTVLYTEDALRLLIKTVGVDRCLFGTEYPGLGSSVDPATGRPWTT
jgi:Amidohydrolase